MEILKNDTRRKQAGMKKDIIEILIGIIVLTFLLWILPFSGCASNPTSIKQVRLKVTFDPPKTGVPIDYRMYSGSETGVYLDTVNLGLCGYSYRLTRTEKWVFKIGYLLMNVSCIENK